MMSMATSVSKGTTESCKTASSANAEGGRTSGRTLSVCANLMKVGPSCSQMTRASRASSASFSCRASTPPWTSNVAVFNRKGTLNRQKLAPALLQGGTLLQPVLLDPVLVVAQR